MKLPGMTPARLKAAGILLSIMLHTLPESFAQADEWTIHASNGVQATVEDIVRQARGVELVLVGEFHDDEVGHAFKRTLLEALNEGSARRLALSLEMFEQDVQLVIDEYLAGHISESHFRASSRAWPGYEAHYRPLVEYAREHGLPVVAANVPRRYVNYVAREGIEALGTLFGQARAMLPPMPLPEVPHRYVQSFRDRTASMHGHGGPSPERMLEAQQLWDAGMALAISERLNREPDVLVMHVAGSFHVEADTGIPDMLRHYRPRTRILTVILRPAASFDIEQHGGLGDFVVITTPSVD
jgi:uncharacterized iron-regulated protein